MKRLTRIFIISAAVVVALLLGGWWYLSMWLRSPETRALVERELSKAIKMPLKFNSLEISLWGGVRAEGVSIQDGGTQFFESTRFTATHRIAPLFSGRFVFSEVTIDAPRFTMVQRGDGSWKFPQLPEAEKAPKLEQAASDKTPKPAATPKPKREPKVFVEKLLVTNGQVDFFDKDHKPVASANGVRITLKDVNEQKVEGRIMAAQLLCNGIANLTDFSAGVSNSEEKGLIIPDFVAKAGGGTITGGYSRKPEKPAKYSAKVKVQDVDIGKAISESGVPAPNVTGLLSAAIDVRGVGNDTKQLSGSAKLTFKNGTCREIEMVNDIGGLLQMEEFANFGIPEATADISIWNGRLNIKPLSITAPPLGLTATGTAKLDGKLDLDAKILADESFIAKRASVASQFEPADANGKRALAFEVNGSLTKPKHNLLERLTGTKDKRMQKVIAIDAALSTLAEGQEAEARPTAKPGKPGASANP